jgi:hypothetical protein
MNSERILEAAWLSWRTSACSPLRAGRYAATLEERQRLEQQVAEELRASRQRIVAAQDAGRQRLEREHPRRRSAGTRRLGGECSRGPGIDRDEPGRGNGTAGRGWRAVWRSARDGRHRPNPWLGVTSSTGAHGKTPNLGIHSTVSMTLVKAMPTTTTGQAGQLSCRRLIPGDRRLRGRAAPRGWRPG